MQQQEKKHTKNEYSKRFCGPTFLLRLALLWPMICAKGFYKIGKFSIPNSHKQTHTSNAWIPQTHTYKTDTYATHKNMKIKYSRNDFYLQWNILLGEFFYDVTHSILFLFYVHTQPPHFCASIPISSLTIFFTLLRKNVYICGFSLNSNWNFSHLKMQNKLDFIILMLWEKRHIEKSSSIEMIDWNF